MLVVDDEDRICRFVGRALRSEGYEVDVATSGPAALRSARAHDYDMVVLDLMLPGLSGHEVLRRLLDERPDRKILVLSAVTDVEARVSCLEGGAVDFLSKPFALAELLARIRSRLRDNHPEPTYPDEVAELPERGGGREGPRDLRVGSLRLDSRRRSLEVDGERRPLSHREYTLLLHLMQHAGRVCTRQELLSDVWGYDFDPGSNIVDVYIRRVRSKLDVDLIETVRNVGYSFRTA
jgi:two-component system OmpR family response regulator